MNAIDIEVLDQRKNEAEKRVENVIDFRNKVDAIADEAAARLADLESKKKKGENSTEYKAMKTHLEQ